MIGEITAYSIISAVLFFNLGLIFVGVLRKNTIFLVKSSTGVLELLFVLSIVRLLIPWDNPYAYLLESEKIIPFVKDSILGYKMNAWLDVGGMLVLVWILGSIIVGCYLFYDLYQEVKTVRNYRTVRNYKVQDEYSCAATPQIRQTGNRLSGLAETAYASLLAQCFV